MAASMDSSNWQGDVSETLSTTPQHATHNRNSSETKT
jgi:hypothetical protein